MSVNTAGQAPGFGAIARQGAIGFAIATVINLILFYIGSAIGAFPPEAVTPMGEPIGVMNVVAFSLFSTIAAIVACYLLYRFLDVARARQIFLILAVLILVVMAYSPFTIPNAPAMQILLLEVMHVVLGGALIYYLLRA